MCLVDLRDHLIICLRLCPCSKPNDTDSYSNETLQTTTTTVKPTTPTAPTPKPILPVQTGVKAQEEEQSSGLTIFFSLLVIGMYISFASSPNICQTQFCFQLTTSVDPSQRIQDYYPSVYRECRIPQPGNAFTVVNAMHITLVLLQQILASKCTAISQFIRSNV